MRPADLLFPARGVAQAEQRCIPAPLGCGKAITDKMMEGYTDIENQEYYISFFCKECQDKVFAPDPDDAEE